MRSRFALIVVLSLFAAATVSPAVRGREVRYAGGTLASFQENTKGILDLQESAAVFTVKNGPPPLSISYAKIESLEYGQKAGRRVGVAVAVNPLFLFSKKRKHFLTIGYTDSEGKKQGAVFELSKGIVRDTLTTFETRSGKSIEYESEEARKHVSGS